MEIHIGIISTTHIDRQGQKMTISALEGMAKQINKKFIPHLEEHDWSRQIGIILYGEVFRLYDGEYGLGAVTGIFENELEKKPFKNGEINLVSKKYKRYLNIDVLRDMQYKNNELSKKLNTNYNIADLLENYLNSTQISPNGELYSIKHFIASTGNLKIEVYPNDHGNPIHFHVISKNGELNARFNLNNFEYINTKYGRITNKQILQIKTFLKENPDIVNKLTSEHNRFSKR